MQTEIIKLNSLKNSISALFTNLSSKFKSQKDYDITVIVRECEQEKKMSSTQLPSQIKNLSKKPSVNFDQNALVINEDLSQSYISLQDKIESVPSFRTDKHIEVNKIQKLLNRWQFKRRDINIQDKQNGFGHQFKHKLISNFTQTQGELIDNNILHTEVKLQDSSLNNDSDRYSFKLNNNQLQSQNSLQPGSEEEDNDSDAGFLIESHLNQALDFVQKNLMNPLQDFLYMFKQKFNFINIRTQTKWSLLMAHCKQSKLQFERAATNYNQVLNTMKQYPRMLSIDIGDIYHRLGLCYFQIRQWNKGISSYSQALNYYKSSKKCIEYAHCIINLGVLYLQIGYYIQAEKCFLMAYNIKRNEQQKSKNNNSNLVPILFHLFDCNLSLKNLRQCQNLLGNINQIVQNAQTPDVMHRIVFQTKMAKLNFFQGRLQETGNHCQQAIKLLNQNRLESKQYCQVLQIFGILKQEEGHLQKSKMYLERTMKSLQKFVPVDSIKFDFLKKKIDMLTQKIMKSKSEKKKTALLLAAKTLG